MILDFFAVLWLELTSKANAASKEGLDTIKKGETVHTKLSLLKGREPSTLW